MALDLHGFEIPESNFQGLHQVARTYERTRERDNDLQRQQQAKKATSVNFLTNYLDPKDSLTGTNYDPQIVKGFDTLLQDGMKLINEGADTNQVMMALAPKVARLNEYSTKAKLVNQRLKDQLAQIPRNAGYDISRLEQEARKSAFTNPDGTMKDITNVDPTVDYITETIRTSPNLVTTDYGIDEYVKNSPKFADTKTVKRVNSKGGYEMRKSKVTAPSWMVVDDEGELVPKHTVALEGGKPHTFNFQTGEGRTKEAAIRLLDEKEFDSIMRGNPGVADYIRGQVQMASPGIDLNSPQAKNAARAILYDELKRRKPGGMEDIEEVKANPAPRVSVRVNTGGKQPAQIDLTEQPDVGEGYKDITSMMGGIKTSILPDGKSFNAKLVYYNPKTQKVKYIEHVEKNDEGAYGGTPKWKEVSLTKFKQDVSTNNPTTDMKFLDGLRNPITGEKTQQEAPKTNPSKIVSTATLKSLIGQKGYEGYTLDELIKYYKSNGYEVK